MAQTTAPIHISFGDEEKVEKIYNMDHGKLLDLTEDAIDQVKSFIKKNPKAANKYFRVFVEGGGCSGMQYGFTFDDKKDDDHVIPCTDIEVLVNPQALIYMKGAVVDFVQTNAGTGFVVKNPQSKGECGCGVSFTV